MVATGAIQSATIVPRISRTVNMAPMLACKALLVNSLLACYKETVSDIPQSLKDYAKEFASRGGKARAAKLSMRRKKEIAQQAAKARWKKRNGNSS